MENEAREDPCTTPASHFRPSAQCTGNVEGACSFDQESDCATGGDRVQTNCPFAPTHRRGAGSVPPRIYGRRTRRSTAGNRAGRGSKSKCYPSSKSDATPRLTTKPRWICAMCPLYLDGRVLQSSYEIPFRTIRPCSMLTWFAQPIDAPVVIGTLLGCKDMEWITDLLAPGADVMPLENLCQSHFSPGMCVPLLSGNLKEGLVGRSFYFVCYADVDVFEVALLCVCEVPPLLQMKPFTYLNHFDVCRYVILRKTLAWQDLCSPYCWE
jgi:hypothetical protein